ncbi:microtubule-associated protein TORTIFOLIA1 isoform X1 [Ricinus communis]|uniref:microtubule-associated protein TORTIFOLIA1 isoform X1 n=1 Tax=Ricinus communis TaxID=3988 RepID=UPI00201ABFED|nr:microtubule-associated protein TORTIFOLIA1 isoform X1 [Ricinus communis]
MPILTMSTQAPKSLRPTTKPSNQNQPNSRSSSLSTHLAMVELKQRIITSLSKLADRDTHQIAIEDLHSITQSISPEALPMLLNSLYDSLSDSSNAKPSVKKESLHLLSLTCQSHRDLTLPHLTKIISHIVKRLKDSDSSVKDACGDAIGVLSTLYLKSGNGNGGGGEGGGGDNNAVGSMVGLFVRPLFEAMGEQNKGVQSGAAVCMAKMVDSAAMEANDGARNGSNVPTGAFQKLCPRICKLLNGQNFQAKAALLGVVTSLAQVGAIAPQGLEPLLQSIHDCLGSTDWATRKAAADALSALALHSRSLITDEVASSTLTVLESCRFDKIKPVRDSMTEALQQWKKIAGKAEDGVLDDQKASSCEGNHPEKAESSSDKIPNPDDQKTESLAKDSTRGSSPNMDSVPKSKAGSIPDKAVVILKKKAPALTDKDLNPEFFQKLETRGSGDLPVEVVVSRRCITSSNLNEEEPELHDSESRGRSNRLANSQSDDLHGSFSKYRNIERGNAGKDARNRAFGDDRPDVNPRESSGSRAGFSKSDGQSEGSFINSKGNWLAIQRQLLQLERQQAHLMNMLQDFMGGSHDSMITLENRVRGLERIVEDMARDLSISSGRRGSNFPIGFEGSNRPLGKYNGFSEYSNAKYNARVPFGERFTQSDVTASGMRGRGPNWRSDMSDAWDFPAYGASRNGPISSRRAPSGGSIDGRSPKSEPESDQVGSRRAWDKGAGPLRFGEGPSARSVWQASKDEATLEAIRVAGEDNGLSRTARVAIPEMTAEAMGDDNGGPERDPIWTSWTNAMDALKMGDMDTAYVEVVSTGDDFLLVKLMDRSGPVIDQLSNETACEVLHAIVQFLLEQNLFDICLSWIHQLVEIVLENGPDVLGIPMELKKELLLNLHEASTAIDPPEDWEGAAPDQLLMQLASAWRIELQQFDK